MVTECFPFSPPGGGQHAAGIDPGNDREDLPVAAGTIAADRGPGKYGRRSVVNNILLLAMDCVEGC